MKVSLTTNDDLVKKRDALFTLCIAQEKKCKLRKESFDRFGAAALVANIDELKVLEHKVNSAIDPQYSAADQVPNIVDARVMEIATQLGPEYVETVKSGELPLINGSTFRQHPELLASKDLDWVSPWFGVREKCLLVHTREKMGKSTIITSDAIQAARNGNRVLWVSAEEFEGEIGRRVVKYGMADEVGDNFVQTLGWPTSFEQLENAIIKCAPDLLVIDSLTSLLSNFGERIPESNKFILWNKLVLKYKVMAATHHLGMILIHHSSKSGDYIGSVGIGQAADAIIQLHRIRKHIHKIGKGGKEVIDHDAEAAAAADGEDTFTNVTRIKYDKLRMDTNRPDVFLEYDPKTGEVNEQCDTFNVAIDSPEHFIAHQLATGPKTKAEILAAAKIASISLCGPSFYKAKAFLQIADLTTRGGVYEASKECTDLVDRTSNPGTSEAEDF